MAVEGRDAPGGWIRLTYAKESAGAEGATDVGSGRLRRLAGASPLPRLDSSSSTSHLSPRRFRRGQRRACVVFQSEGSFHSRSEMPVLERIKASGEQHPLLVLSQPLASGWLFAVALGSRCTAVRAGSQNAVTWSAVGNATQRPRIQDKRKLTRALVAMQRIDDQFAKPPDPFVIVKVAMPMDGGFDVRDFRRH